MSNHLKQQTSPYLLQHAENPVDWYPWCEEAFEHARKEDKPIFLSIGYSTCHWCHVMAHESFSDESIAECLNQNFISIKVDREERPDIDSVYMAVCQAFTGHGGWPMSIFMTADQKPFFAGTYFPPTARFGALGFQELLLAVAEKWKSNRTALLQSSEQIVRALKQKEKIGNREINPRLPEQAAQMFAESFDERYGGFGPEPKFPMPHNLIFLILYSVQRQDEKILESVKITLEQMRKGGIFDQIGYGFCRYSTDRFFLVPHFEKMLYDNALLILAYAVAYHATGEALFLDTAEKTAKYVRTELTSEEGGFYSAQDADSDGEEGKFYVWSPKEVCEVLGPKRGREFCAYFDITDEGNFHGKSIPNRLHSERITTEFQEEVRTLYEYRKKRGNLHLDDKILTSWNGLMICALAILYRVSGKEEYLKTAKKACQFIEAHLAKGSTLYVSWREGVCSEQGFLDEYAYMILADLTLYEVTEDSRYRKRAKQLCEEVERQFADEKYGGYFLTGTENGELIIKPKETYDGALPSGNAVMAYCLVRLSLLTEEAAYKEKAERQLAFLSKEMEQYPAGYSVTLLAMLMQQNPQKVTVVLEKGADKKQIRSSLPLDARIDWLSEETEVYKRLNGKTTFYYCKDHRCYPASN